MGSNSYMEEWTSGQDMCRIILVLLNVMGNNLSSRELTEIQLEIWNMYHIDPDKVVVDFNSTATAWYDAVDLTRLIASDNKITYIDARVQEFGALVAVDVI